MKPSDADAKEVVSAREIFALLRALRRLDGGPEAADGPPGAAHAAERERLLERLPREIARLHERLYHARRRPTVVETFHEHCEGCHMRVPPQVMLLLTRAEVICRCPNCHRFLSPPGLDEDRVNA